tara:strand:+ start:935 stop:1321 length:387 start_codon:yes stop_codon:yes gene_type:complete
MAVKKLINVDVIKKDLLIAKNVDYEQLFTITDKTTGSGVSFSGFTSSILTSRIKQHPNSTSVAATFTSSYSDASSGIIKLELSDEETRDLKSGRYFYDVVVINEDKPDADVAGDLHTERLVEGQLILE